MNALDRLRLERGAVHLHALGARAVGEFIAEAVLNQFDVPETLEHLDMWCARLTPEMVCIAGGDKFPPRPLHAVPR